MRTFVETKVSECKLEKMVEATANEERKSEAETGNKNAHGSYLRASANDQERAYYNDLVELIYAGDAADTAAAGLDSPDG